MEVFWPLLGLLDMNVQSWFQSLDNNNSLKNKASCIKYLWLYKLNRRSQRIQMKRIFFAVNRNSGYVGVSRSRGAVPPFPCFEKLRIQWDAKNYFIICFLLTVLICINQRTFRFVLRKCTALYLFRIRKRNLSNWKWLPNCGTVHYERGLRYLVNRTFISSVHFFGQATFLGVVQVQ